MPILTGYVHVLHPDTRDIITLAPGDTLPDWASGIVTNPDVLRDEAEPAPEPTPEQPEPVAVKRGRKKADPEPTPEDPRAELTAKAVALGIEIGPETTEAEIQALIEAKE